MEAVRNVKRPFRIGCGAGFSSDRLEPAADLVARGRLDAIVLECLAERTLASGHRNRMRDPSKGCNPWLERRMRTLLPLCHRHGTRLITNMGAANPAAAVERTLTLARELGLKGMRIACITGDDVTRHFPADTQPGEGSQTGTMAAHYICANAYLGIDALIPALMAEADVVISGRVADPSLFLAGIVHHFDWAPDDWQRLGAGTLAGHLLECGMQVTGGYFADPGYKDVPDLAHCGFPLAEIDEDGTFTITKLDGTGGMVTLATVKEQLLYEVHDPACYLTPDVTADFSQTRLEQTGRDRVRVRGAKGSPQPQQLKVTLGFDGGFVAEAGISYAGGNAAARGELARSILRERLSSLNGELRLDLIGVDSLHGTASSAIVRNDPPARDVRLRAAMRTADRETADTVLWEVEALLCCGPAGGGGFRGTVTSSVTTRSASIDRGLVRPECIMVTA
ncbi:MAG: DUF1446 domain-containing protein [Geminicoccaceae bacterium]|nr:DUF1446 domain-containing protein [Geminicoccaceae bacterium]